MTATAQRPVPPQRAERRSRRPANPTAVRRTLLALLATGLGIVPLKGLFSDSGWLIDVWVSILVVLGPAALLRMRRPPGALDIWPGIVLLVPWLTVRFLSETAVGGLIPTGQTWTTLSTLMSQLHETTRDEVAPIHTTVPVRLVLCALVGLLAALVDLIAVVGRRGALAGVPLLVVFTVSGAVPREPVAWPYFAVAALGFLILLAIDAGDEQANWGRRVRATGSRAQRGAATIGTDGERSTGQTGRAARSALAVAAPRIGIIAVIAAVALPLLVPGEPRNLLANAFHGSDGVGGFGGGNGSNGELSPYSNLKGQLRDRDNPVKLAEVQMLSTGNVDPYYLRSNVLSDYRENQGWRVGSHGDRTPIGSGRFDLAAGGSPRTVSLSARITVSGMRGVPAVFGNPVGVDGLPSDTGWSPKDQLLLDSSVNEDTQYTVRFDQPAPTVAQLSGASDYIDPVVRSELALPSNLPAYVRNLVADQTAGAQTQYAKARKLSDFFANPDNGFVYDLATTAGDSGSDLVDFLQKRRGFCQQYAGAMGVLMRVAGIPARVVLGYLNSGPNRSGRFDVSTLDAHAWVEGWFDGIGWVPFDPTPASGLPGGGGTLPWAPRDTGQDSPGASSSSAAPSSSSSAAPSSSAAGSSSSTFAAPVADDQSTSSSTGLLIGGGVLVILVLALVPAAVRASRRRRRYLAARRDGDAEQLWHELSDTALDLGYVWTDARSPRQVASWLAPDAPRASTSLQTLADAVEQRRYSGGATGSDPGAISEALREVTDELREHRSSRTRLRARFWPASLGWTTPFGGSGRREL